MKRLFLEVERLVLEMKRLVLGVPRLVFKVPRLVLRVQRSKVAEVGLGNRPLYLENRSWVL